MINRSAVLVRPRAPFLEWARSHGDGLEYPLDDDRTVYLLPEWETEDDADAVLRHFYDIVFEEELSAWVTDPTTWPKNRSYETFLEWFEVEPSAIVRDLVADEPIEDDED